MATREDVEEYVRSRYGNLSRASFAELGDDLARVSVNLVCMTPTGSGTYRMETHSLDIPHSIIRGEEVLMYLNPDVVYNSALIFADNGVILKNRFGSITRSTNN